MKPAIMEITLKHNTAIPVCRQNDPMFSLSLITCIKMITTRNTIENILTGFCNFVANELFFLSKNMPIATGNRMIAKICSTSENRRGIYLLSSIKYCIERLTMIGNVRMQSRLATAVRVILSTTSPLARSVKKLEVTPPGEADIKTNPTAISGVRLNIIAIPKQTAGKKSIWQTKPRRTDLR